nr:hypothetical protein [Nonomuraea maritima]
MSGDVRGQVREEEEGDAGDVLRFAQSPERDLLPVRVVLGPVRVPGDAALGQGSADHRGVHGVHPDGVGAEFDGGGAGQRRDAALAGAADGDPGDAEFGEDRAVENDGTAPPLAFHLRDLRLQREESALEISVDQVVPHFFAEFGQRADGGGAGVVESRVQAAETADDLVDDVVRGGDVGRVRLDEHRLAAGSGDLLDHLHPGLGPPSGQRDLGAFLREQQRGSPADPGRAAGDERDLAFEQSHAPYPSSGCPRRGAAPRAARSRRRDVA